MATPQVFYDGTVWIAIITNTCVTAVNAYLCWRLSKKAKGLWRWWFYGISLIFFTFALVRTIVMLVYYEDFVIRTLIPVTGTITMILAPVFIGMYMLYTEQKEK